MFQINKLPLIQINSSSRNRGIYEKEALISKSFSIINSTNTLFISNKEKLSLIFTLKHTYRKKLGFLLEILFHGLNFSSKRIKRQRPKYFVDTHKSEYYICNELAANPFKSRVHKRRLLFFSYDRHLLYQIETLIKGFKLPDIYTGKGLFARTDLYKRKIGKIRKK